MKRSAAASLGHLLGMSAADARERAVRCVLARCNAALRDARVVPPFKLRVNLAGARIDLDDETTTALLRSALHDGVSLADALRRRLRGEVPLA